MFLNKKLYFVHKTGVVLLSSFDNLLLATLYSE